MRNRQPTPGMEGRVLITPEDGSSPFYARMTMADNPLEQGTPWAKETVLRDETAEILGLDTDAVPDDAFLAVLLQSRQLALVEVAVTVNGQPAIAGIEILNLTTLSGDRVFTDARGKAVVYAPAGKVTILTPTYEDLAASNSATLDITVGEKRSATLNIASSPVAGTKTLTASKSGIRFSPYVAGVDVCSVAAGAGGGAGYSESTTSGIITTTYYGGDGGGMGEIVNSLNIQNDYKTSYSAIVGAKGIGASATSTGPTTATAGGDTSFMGVHASGGKPNEGGSGAIHNTGNSGLNKQPEPGIDSTTRVFNDTNFPLVGGSGGGSGTNSPYTAGQTVPTNGYGASGGAPGGGDGATLTKQAPCVGESGSAPGAGGGGGYNFGQSALTVKVGGDGADGAVYYRWRVT